MTRPGLLAEDPQGPERPEGPECPEGPEGPEGGPEGRLLRINLPGGVPLNYVAAGDGRTVIFLHGGMGDCLSWAPQVAAFATHFHVVSYSRRYHFPNPPPLRHFRHSWQDEVRDLGDFLRLLGCGPAHLIGTSYGALTALAYALEQPARVLSLVLVEPPLPSWVAADPQGSAVRDAFMGEVWDRARMRFRRGQHQRAMQALYDGMRGRGAFAALNETQRSAVMRNARAMQMLVCSSNAFPDLDTGKVARLQVPTLLVSGQETVPFHRHAHRALAGVLPGARQALIEGAGHAPAMENARRFNCVALQFLT